MPSSAGMTTLVGLSQQQPAKEPETTMCGRFQIGLPGGGIASECQALAPARSSNHITQRQDASCTCVAWAP
eukprot:14268881-Alexandrium_andersonii.AAC.1